MLDVERYVEAIVCGCRCPDVRQAVGVSIPRERRWDANGFQPRPNLRGTLHARSRHGDLPNARNRLAARQKAREANAS